jgi:hypothetical protein
MERSRVRVENKAGEDKHSKWKEAWRCVETMTGRHGMVEIKLLCFRWLSDFFKRVQKGFPGFA